MGSPSPSGYHGPLLAAPPAHLRDPPSPPKLTAHGGAPPHLLAVPLVTWRGPLAAAAAQPAPARPASRATGTKKCI